MDVKLSPALSRAVAASVDRNPSYRLYGVVWQGKYRRNWPTAVSPALRKLIELDLAAGWRAGQWINPEQWQTVRLTEVTLNERGRLLALQLAGKRCRICESARVRVKGSPRQEFTRFRCSDCGSEFDVFDGGAR